MEEKIILFFAIDYSLKNIFCIAHNEILCEISLFCLSFHTACFWQVMELSVTEFVKIIFN